MKLYLASSFDLIDMVEFVSDALERRGHEITVKWWSSDWCGKDLKHLPCSEPEWYSQDVIRRIFEADLNRIREADAVILIASMNEVKKFNGANVEIGIAIALGKPVYSYGRLDRSAMYWPITHYGNLLRELLDHFETISRKEAARV